MIETIKPEELNYEKLEDITKGLILINPKHKELVCQEVKRWIFKKALKNYGEQDDEVIEFFMDAKTPEEVKDFGIDRVNNLVKAQTEFIRDGQLVLQFKGVGWLDENILIIIKK